MQGPRCHFPRLARQAQACPEEAVVHQVHCQAHHCRAAPQRMRKVEEVSVWVLEAQVEVRDSKKHLQQHLAVTHY